MTGNDDSIIELWPHDPLGHPNKPMGDDNVRTEFSEIVDRSLAKINPKKCRNAGRR